MCVTTWQSAESKPEKFGNKKGTNLADLTEETEKLTDRKQSGKPVDANLSMYFTRIFYSWWNYSLNTLTIIFLYDL